MQFLKQKYPVNALKEMFRISKKYVVIVEINNTNIPMFLISLLNYNVERNALFYNKTRVIELAEKMECSILYAENMNSCYISGNSYFYRILARIGNPPYNIVIAEKKNVNSK